MEGAYFRMLKLMTDPNPSKPAAPDDNVPNAVPVDEDAQENAAEDREESGGYD